MEKLDTVPALLEQAQTVAIGAFNPYVVTPSWLIKFRVCAEADEINVRMVPLGDGATFNFGSVQWHIDGHRLSVSTSDREVDCGGLVSRVLALVPHTPVRTVEHNFQFTAMRAEWAGRPEPRLGLKGMEDLDGVEQVRWSGSFRRDDARLEVTLASEPDLIAILFNFHRNMDLEAASAATTAEGQIAEARDAAVRFQADFDFAREMLRSVFGMEMANV